LLLWCCRQQVGKQTDMHSCLAGMGRRTLRIPMRRKISVMKRGIPHTAVRAMKKAPVLPGSSASSPASTPAQPKEQRSELTKTNRVAEEEIPPSASPDHGEWDAGFSSTAHPGQPAFRGFLVSQALREPSGARHLSSTMGLSSTAEGP